MLELWLLYTPLVPHGAWNLGFHSLFFQDGMRRNLCELDL